MTGTIKVRRSGYVAERHVDTWVVRRGGKRIVMHARKKRWRVRPTTYERRDVGYGGRGTPTGVYFVARGARKRVPKGSKVIRFTPGALEGYGIRKPAEERRRILRRLARRDGPTTVFRRLNLLRIFWTTKRGNKRVAKPGFKEHVRRLEADVNWLRREYGIGRR